MSSTDAVRGPKHVVNKGRTPVLDRAEAQALLGTIAVVKKVQLDYGTVTEIHVLVVLRDCALIGVMTYSFARIGAVLQMNLDDYFTQGRRGWVHSHEKGGKEH